MERAHSNLQVTMALLLQVVLHVPATTEAGAQALVGDALASRLKGNVVRIVSQRSAGPPTTGFGFVVGERAGFIYIVTADHVVRDPNVPQTPETPGIYFFADPGKEYRGDLLSTRLMPDFGDVAVIRIQAPPGFTWRRDVLANMDPIRGADVWFIGLGNDWFVPARPGTVNSVEANRIRFEALSIRQGASGAPLLAQTGMIGMVVSASDVYAEATSTEVIERAFADWRYPWQLTKSGADVSIPTPRIPGPPAPPVPPSSSSPTGPAAPARAPAISSLPPPPEPPAMSAYTTRNNRDIWLNDIPLLDGSIGFKNIILDECAKKCTSNSKCVGFSYDRWNKTCYLKTKMTESIIDAHSMIAIKKPAELPNVSREPATIELIRNRRIHGDLWSSKRVVTFEACKALCNEEIQCIAFNFLKSASPAANCELYKMADDHNRDIAVDGGYKRQIR